MARKPASPTAPATAARTTTKRAAAKKSPQKKPAGKKAATNKVPATKPDVAAKSTKSERTRQRVMDAAAYVLSIKGFAGMRLSDVAEQAELQAPAIYYYFKSREDLIEEVMWAGIADMREHLLSVLDEAPDGMAPMDRILLAVEAHLRHELQISDYTTAAIRNAGQLPDELRKRFDVESKKYGEIWRSLFDRARDEGAIRDDLDPYVAQMLAMGALNWAAEWWTPRRGSIDTVVATAQAIVRNGLAPD